MEELRFTVGLYVGCISDRVDGCEELQVVAAHIRQWSDGHIRFDGFAPTRPSR